ncbi:hypothetical protein BpHYR1_027699 [Brachionus plicatilis]|uniref:Uncharacterized protein n=1 Tax=Brachionus plicatilis TaxID=10195 RepID=A0A3M7Q603_BRAPC|nr:hypothetical protein BpHYR1_027699 [Brachionus plicatilis]
MFFVIVFLAYNNPIMRIRFFKSEIFYECLKTTPTDKALVSYFLSNSCFSELRRREGEIKEWIG